MTALSAARNTPRLEAGNRQYGLAASTSIWQGSLVCLNSSGYAVKGATATSLSAAGRAEETVDNGAGAAGDRKIDVKPGTYRWANSASADQITIADRGKTAYVVDDQTVAKTDGSSTRSAAGTIIDVDALGVWVKSGIGI
jgi:hypothetical protein